MDTLAWSSLSLAFHALSLHLLLWDQRRIRFASADEEQLWRFFYRRSGMGRLEMKEVRGRASLSCFPFASSQPRAAFGAVKSADAVGRRRAFHA
jgi:hypothetical protein